MKVITIFKTIHMKQGFFASQETSKQSNNIINLTFQHQHNQYKITYNVQMRLN